jgi:hypothetical protein
MVKVGFFNINKVIINKILRSEQLIKQEKIKFLNSNIL